MATTRKTTTTRKPAARKAPTDRLPKGGTPELPDFNTLPGHEYFKPLNKISADAAFDALEAMEESGFKDKAEDEIKISDIRGIMKIVFTEDFLADVEKFRDEFYTAENTDDAGVLAVAFLGVLGKGKR
ncbi:hypothetical protein [Rothia mucilaginosa]